MLTRLYTRLFKRTVILITLISVNHLAIASDALIETKKLEYACHQNGWTIAKYIELKNRKFDEAKPALAFQLLNCLASPNPELRDGIAFEALSQWLRADAFTNTTYHTMFTTLIAALRNKVLDEFGVYQPFAALALGEVLRVDRKSPYLTEEERSLAINIITTFYVETSDYRGFDESVGWRHSIPHSADAMLQLALNPAVEKPQLNQMLKALATQIVPKQNHFYHYGEPKRIAIPVIYIMLQGMHTQEEWKTWLLNVTDSTPFENWNSVYKSQQGLAKLHNTREFLNTLYVIIKPSKNEVLVGMVPALEEAIKLVN